MANLKNITELPVAESAEGLKLIVNDNGAAKQIAASAVGAQADFAITDESDPGFIKNKPEVVQADWAEADESSPAFIKNKPEVAQADWAETNENSPAYVKNKPHKELVYEWNFSAEDDVLEVRENVDGDLSWLTVKQDNVRFEIVAELYAQTYNHNYETGEDYNYQTLENSFSTLNSIESNYEITHYTNVPYYDNPDVTIPNALVGELYGYGWVWVQISDEGTFSTNVSINDYVYFEIMHKLHINDDGDFVAVDQGGFTYFNAGNPVKSIKIYKVTR